MTRKNGLPRRVYVHHGRYVFMEDLAEMNPLTRRPKQKQHSLTRISEGTAAMLKALAAVLEARNAKRRAGSMAAMIDAWLADGTHGFGKYMPSTQVEYLRMATRISEAFIDFDATDVRPADIAEFVDSNFSKTLNAANKYKALLSVIFSFGVRKGYRNDNPCRDVRGYSEGRRKRYITDEELT